VTGVQTCALPISGASTLADAPVSAFYLWGRAATAVLGSATVYLVYRCGRRWNEPAALLAAAFMAVMPLHVRESHFALTDVPATFFVALTWDATMTAMERGNLRRFAIAGVAAGCAASTKYNAVFAVVMPLLACTNDGLLDARLIKRLGVVLIAAGAVFLITTPYVILDLPAFLDGFARLVAAYQGAAPAEAPAVTYAKHLQIAFEWPGTIAVAAGLLLAAAHAVKGPARLRWAFPVLCPALYYAFISRQHVVFARYLLPMVPFLTVVAAIAIVDVYRLLAQTPMRRAVRAGIAAVAAAGVMLPGAITSFRFDREISRTWTGELAYRWILSNVPRGSHVVIETRNLVLPESYRATNVPQLREKRVEDYRAEGVGYLVASSQCYGPYLASPTSSPGPYADYERLFNGTTEVARFTPSDRHPGSELRILKVPQ